MKHRWVVVCLVAVALSSATASAEPRSWTAVKAKLPAGSMAVFGVDVAAIRKLPSFPKFFDSLLAVDKDFPQLVGAVKSTCGIDPVAAIADVTIVLDPKEKVLAAIAFDGLTEAKLLACANKLLVQTDPKRQITKQTAGNVTEYGMPNEPDKVYATWLASDIVVVGAKPGDRTQLDGMLAGKPATGELATQLGKVDVNALAWTAFAPDKDLIKSGYGAISFAKTKATLAVRMTAVTPKDGAAMVKDGRHDIVEATKRANQQKLPQLAKILKLVKIGGKGADVTVDATIAESDLPLLLPALDKAF
ncbi:MAG TPA: hypothetical protein VFQ53_22845 [Kofleriaceae bacterium]|nr:hypothetical protein [Kofleriaceae bacterium]